MEFGWDEAKHERNLRKRGFGFDFAARIFERPVATTVDNRRDYGEVRKKATGEVEDSVLTVIYTDRGDIRWIISARLASRKERRSWRE